MATKRRKKHKRPARFAPAPGRRRAAALRVPRILFLQLPQLDNDVSGAHENVPLAAIYLEHALERSPEARHFRAEILRDDVAGGGDARLVRAIVSRRPVVIAATLYLWNVERTLHVLERVRRRLPALKVVAGGPEVAPDNPFLFESAAVDVAVAGEGERVFPDVLRALRTSGRTDFASVAWRVGERFEWGRTPPPPFDLRRDLPPPGHRLARPDRSGMAYLETSRGCPLRCTYCCYGHRRTRVTFLPAQDVLPRVRILAARGAKEIRFIDPTFNANPDFRRIVAALAALNRGGRLRFFAELRPDALTRDDARGLARAGFREIEVGVQSRNRATLRRIGRPSDPGRVEKAVRDLARAGIEVTVDMMYGLTGQTAREIRANLRWAAGLRGVYVQCLQTLLLPGTVLRAECGRWAMTSCARPPYQVEATSTLSRRALRAAEERARKLFRTEMDCPTRRFVGRALPDQFPTLGPRRRMTFQGLDLFARRDRIARAIRRAVRAEPHGLWQFVLEPRREEPLDLLYRLVAEIRRFPPLVQDQFVQTHSPGRIASRRIFIRLLPRRRYDRAWQEAAEDRLRSAFY